MILNYFLQNLVRSIKCEIGYFNYFKENYNDKIK